MKNFILLLIALLAVFGVFQFMKAPTLQASQPMEILEKFNAWKIKYNKQFTNEDDEAIKLVIFTENYDYIETENRKNQPWFLGENDFMDLTHEEFVATKLGKLIYNGPNSEIVEEEYKLPNDAFNWVDKGAVTPIKNQGSCGSCWSFSTTGVVEGYWFLNKGTLPSLSEQQLVDCATAYGNHGCNGGWPANALKYVKDKGLVTEAEYPYTAKDGTCKVQGGPYKINKIYSYNPVMSVKCQTLLDYIAIEPTSVAVDANNWQFYKGGVFSNCKTNMDHAVLATGYDASGNWIIKNSWGTSWGEKGYITLKSGNTCDVCHHLAYAQ